MCFLACTTTWRTRSLRNHVNWKSAENSVVLWAQQAVQDVSLRHSDPFHNISAELTRINTARPVNRCLKAISSVLLETWYVCLIGCLLEKLIKKSNAPVSELPKKHVRLQNSTQAVPTAFLCGAAEISRVTIENGWKLSIQMRSTTRNTSEKARSEAGAREEEEFEKFVSLQGLRHANHFVLLAVSKLRWQVQRFVDGKSRGRGYPPANGVLIDDSLARRPKKHWNWLWKSFSWIRDRSGETRELMQIVCAVLPRTYATLQLQKKAFINNSCARIHKVMPGHVSRKMSRGLLLQHSTISMFIGEAINATEVGLDKSWFLLIKLNFTEKSDRSDSVDGKQLIFEMLINSAEWVFVGK